VGRKEPDREKGKAGSLREAMKPMGDIRRVRKERIAMLNDRKTVDLRVLVLALATFAIGTGTFMVTGLLGGVAEDLSISIGTAGHLMTVFAAAYALLSPVLVAATARVGRRRLLVSALALFAVANAAAAVAPTFSLLLTSRIASACFAAVCTPVALATATQLVPSDHKGRALSVIIGGISVSWVVGVPAGALIVDQLGWRASFVLAAALAILAATGVRTLLPAVANTAPTGSLASLLTVVGRPVVLITLIVTVLAMVSGFTVLTYVRPLLESLTDFGGEGIGSMLLLFGLAAIAGSVLGGYSADRWGYRATVVPVLVIQGLALLSFSLLSAAGTDSVVIVAGAAVALAAWGVVAFALVPLQQYRLIGVAPDEQGGVLSLNSSAVYVGQGLGAGLGWLVLGYSSPAVLGYAGAVLAAVALVVLVLGTRLPIRRATEPEAPAYPIAEQASLSEVPHEAQPYTPIGHPCA
jgi:MFS transporter, DHA1 family, inner membrane transport protein